MIDCSNAKLSSMHFYGWKLGLKTGQYYLRTKAATDAIQFTVEAEKMTAGDKVTAPQLVTDGADACDGAACSIKPSRVVEEEDEGCTMCSG